MATNTHERNHLRFLYRLLEDIRITADATDEPFVRAAGSLLTAASYQDSTLVRSALEELKAATEALFTESVESRVKNSSLALGQIRQFTEQFEGSPIQPDGETDDIGRSVSKVVAQALDALQGFRDSHLVVARKFGAEVPNAGKLDEQIALWEQVKANLVDCWPWTDAPLPPADREMIAASRAALQAGERGESLEAVIARRRSK